MKFFLLVFHFFNTPSMKPYLFLLSLVLIGSSCVTKKKYLAFQGEQQALVKAAEQNLADCQFQLSQLKSQLQIKETELQSRLREMQNKDGELTDKRNQVRLLEDQIALLKGTNASLLDRLSDLSVISKSGAESINKSLQAISEQSKYIQDLTGQMQRKDSLSLSLVNTLKRSLSDVNDQDLTIEVKKGVVYVSISDKLLFRSGSHDINDRAQSVLSKVASVVNDHKDIDILVEGHTDNLSISNSCTIDNWDLSVRRATSVVRFLQQKHQVDPKRMTAGGRGEFSPKVENDSAAGRQANRRTEIIITPKLDQFFNLLSSPESKN